MSLKDCGEGIYIIDSAVVRNRRNSESSVSSRRKSFATMTYTEARKKILTEGKHAEDRQNILVEKVIRPISIRLTLPFVGSKMTPTAVTKCSLVASTIGFFLLAFGGNQIIRMIGWIAIILWVVMDHVDGNLARCTKRCTALGDLWDTTAGYAAMVYIYFGAGIAAFHDSNVLEFCGKHWYLILGGMTAIFSIFPRLVMHKKKSSAVANGAVAMLSDKSSFGFVRKAALNILSPVGFVVVFLAAAILLHGLNLFIAVYFTLNFGMMLIALFRLLKE